MTSLPVIPEAIPLVTTEHDRNNAVWIYFTCHEEVFLLEVLRTQTLRDVQKRLCDEFRQHFPLMCAKLINAGRQIFDNFIDILAGGWSKMSADSQNMLYQWCLVWRSGFSSTSLIAESSDLPFLNAEPDEVYEVSFHLTRDMYWFDITTRTFTHSPSPIDENAILEFSLD